MEDNMTMLSIPLKDKERFKKLAKADGRTMRAAFKIMLDEYEKKTKKKGK